MEGAPGDGALQVVDECLDVDLGPVEVPVHQGLVLALGDDPLDEAVAGLLERRPLLLGGRVLPPLARGVVEDPLGEESGEPGERGVPVGALGAVDGQMERKHGIGVGAAEDLAADPGHLLERGACRVQVGDDDGARHADGRALLPDGTGGTRHRVGLLRGGHDEQGRVRRAQTGPELPDEIRVAGGVQQIDLVPAPFDGDQGELYGTLLAVFDLVVVGDGGAVLDPARPVDGARSQCEGLDERGLSGAAVADQHHIPYG